MIAVIDHHKNGGKLQAKGNFTDEWRDVNKPKFNFMDLDYRIKPEPMTLWLEVSGSGRIFATHYTKPSTQEYPHTNLKKFAEVTE